MLGNHSKKKRKKKEINCLQLGITNFSRFLTTSRVGYLASKLIERAMNLTKSSTTFFYYVRSTSDIDECNEAHPFKMNKCHPNASFTNTQGSYNCSFNPTFIGDSFDCEF